MIRTDDQLQRTREALIDLESSLASLKPEMPIFHPARLVMWTDPIVFDIRKLRAEIEEYIGLTMAIFARADLWLRLEGADLEPDYAASSIVTSAIDSVRTGILALAASPGLSAHGPFGPVDVADACDLRIIGWMPGKLEVGLMLPELIPPVFDESSVHAQARRALKLYLQAVSWVGTPAEQDRLEQEIPDPELRRLALQQVGRLVPKPSSPLELVEVASKHIKQGPMRLRPEALERIHAAVSSAAGDGAGREAVPTWPAAGETPTPADKSGTA